MRVYGAIENYLKVCADANSKVFRWHFVMQKHRLWETAKESIAIEVYSGRYITYAMALDETHTQDYFVPEVK